MNRAIKSLDNITSLGGKAHPMLTRFIRYFMSAGSFTLLDFALLLILVDFANIFYLLATVISFIIANTSHYFVAREWGFKGTSRAQGEGYLFFLAFGAISLALTIFFMELFVHDFGWHYLIAKLFVACIIGLINFFMHYYITFKLHLIKKRN